MERGEKLCLLIFVLALGLSLKFWVCLKLEKLLSLGLSSAT